MKCSDVIQALEERWNPSFALEWDNVGLLVGREDKEVNRILVALDASDEAVSQAEDLGADLLITHHPLIFSGIRQVTSGNFIGKRIIRLIQKDICCYAMHTNFDVLGMGRLNEKALGLENTRVLMETCQADGRGEGIGRVGELPGRISLGEFAVKVKNALQIPDVRVYGDPDWMVERAAVSGGSGKGMAEKALACGADVLVTGDIDYHTGIDAAARKLAVIDAGHYGTEYGFIEYMKGELETMFPRLTVEGARICHPYRVM